MRPIMFAALTLFAPLLGGCCDSYTSLPKSVAVTTGSGGMVVGGQQPVTNASIQVYSVGITGDGSIATPILTKAVTTDANGSFSISGLYSCSNATEVYLTATGGDPTPGLTNSNLVMMTALGPCTSLNPGSPIVVNELTTVAAVNALASYMTSYSSVGSGTGDSASLDSAFTVATELVNPATGTSPGTNVPTGYTVPTAQVNTMGDVIAPCINSGGGIAGDGSPCGNLFKLATPSGGSHPTNTVGALLDLVKNPSLDDSSLSALIPADPPFQPQLTELTQTFPITLTAPPVAGSLVLSPTNISFPATPVGGKSPVQAVSLTNSSPYEVPVSNIAIVGANLANFSETNDCPATLAVGALCTIQTIFAPLTSTESNATLQVNGGLVSITLSGGVASPAWPTALLAANPSLYLNFNESTSSFLDQVSGLAFSTGGGMVTPSQPGFDNTTPRNTSAEFAWNAWNAAPNATLADLEWDAPWTMMIQVDRLNWNRTGSLVLASKGDISNPTKSWWKLTLGMVWGNFSQLCFTRNGGGPGAVQDGICTAPVSNDPIGFDAMPNGFNYNIVVESDGTGAPPSMYINGLQVQSGSNPQIPGGSNTTADGFGFVNLSVSGGTGYADLTGFTSTGGGPDCHVTGLMWASEGIPYNGDWIPNGSNNYGCTSSPTIVLTSPSGTGAVVTATLGDVSMNSTEYPLMVPGYVSGGTYYGIAGTTSTQSPTYIDEFAIFPGTLSQAQLQTLFFQTKFYQGLVNTASPKPVVIVDDDTYDDIDNEFTLEMAIALHEAGLITLAGVVVDSNAPGSAAGWRQMLDYAGLQNVPVSIPPGYPSGDPPPTSILMAYNSATPMTLAAYESSTTMYRTIFAEYPTTPIKVLLGAPNWLGFADFMQSPADNISPLTGLQLVAQNGANGGVAFGQGYLWDTSANGAYIVANNQTMPIIWIGGTPMNAGPGVLSTRNDNDPMYLFANYIGTDVRQCYDCLMVEAAVSSLFTFGVQVNYSGGIGYANSTPFTLSGGGPNCQGSGFMTANAGVPNGIQFSWGQSAVGVYSGIGSGCMSAPTVNLIGPTGSGVTLTATPSPCGKITVSGGVASFSTNSCGKQYVSPGTFNTNQSPISGVVMTWFINSLVDPIP